MLKKDHNLIFIHPNQILLAYIGQFFKFYKHMINKLCHLFKRPLCHKILTPNQIWERSQNRTRIILIWQCILNQNYMSSTYGHRKIVPKLCLKKWCVGSSKGPRAWLRSAASVTRPFYKSEHPNILTWINGKGWWRDIVVPMYRL